MKLIKRIWNLFFPRQVEFPPVLDRIKSHEESRRVKFFEPVTSEDKFNSSEDLADFIKKIDK